jgi:NAD(P)H-hydrate epimerase
MLSLATGTQLRAIDARAISEFGIPGRTLMENAGKAVADFALREYGPAATLSALVVCGKGNNGGDGFVAARHLHQAGARVVCVLLAGAAELAGDARTCYGAMRETGVTVLESASLADIGGHIETSTIIVDCILGTGLRSAPHGGAADVIELLNRSGRSVLAVDVPSGVDADTGAVPGAAVRARATVTMGLAKTGLCLYPGRAHAGTVEVADIGYPPELAADADTFLLTAGDIRRALPVRRPDAHKGTMGSVLLVAGSRDYSGAACLAAAAAVRSGCGLVHVAIPAGIGQIVGTRVPEAIRHQLPETTGGSIAPAGLEPVLAVANQVDAIAVGPGLSTSPETFDFLSQLLPTLARPLVIDADALNCLAASPELLSRLKCPVVLTPHPGEFSRLLRLERSAVSSDPLGCARRFATTRQVTTVLKGAATVIATSDGKAFINPTGNSGLATGGTGDVLTGLLGGLLAQKAPPAAACCAAVYLHGLAGDIAAAELTEYCLCAGDVVEWLPRAFRTVLGEAE